MSDTLLALLLVTESANGSSIVFRWPPNPHAIPRLSRPRPADTSSHDVDNPWRAFPDRVHPVTDASHAPVFSDAAGDDDDYEWRIPHAAVKDRTRSFASRSASIPPSGRSSPGGGGVELDSLLSQSVLSFGPSGSIDDGLGADDSMSAPVEYRTVLGFGSKLLASLLAPAREMCHQQFELVIDDLAFIGHPVCADTRGRWTFRSAGAGRGRGERATPDPSPAEDVGELQTFHLVVVLDLPDPSAAGAGAVARYISGVYERVAFVFAAVLFHAQVTTGFVERECETMLARRETCISAGRSYSEYTEEALESSELARAIKEGYEGLQDGDTARITLVGMPLELQLPPKVDASNIMEGEEVDPDAEEDGEPGVPTLAPWKAILLLDSVPGSIIDLPTSTSDPSVSAIPAAAAGFLPSAGFGEEDRALVEGLLRLLDLAQITLSLADVAAGLDWQLDSQVYPTVRWLVQHRRARIVNVVHPRLKTRFALPATFPTSLESVTKEFAKTFGHTAPPLPSLLADLTAPRSPKEPALRAPCNVDAVRWLLQRDMLVRLHLRLRVRVPPALKALVREKRERKRAMAKRGRGGKERSRREPSVEEASEDGHDGAEDGFFPFSPHSARLRTRGPQHSSMPAARSRLRNWSREKEGSIEEEKEESSELDTDDEEDTGWSIIADPSAATAKERRWLYAMSEDKHPALAERFNQVSQYFDGKRTDDEILYRGQITRRQFKEIIGAYSEYLEELLHP